MQEADSRGSTSVLGKYDRTRRIGDRCRSGMRTEKALDTHVNVEAELKTWLCVKPSNRENQEENRPGRVPLAYWIGFLQALYQLIPMETSIT